MNHFSILIRLLRDRPTFLDEVRNGIKLESKIASLLVSSSVFFAIHGGIIGAYSSPLQIISSAIKLPALYLLTLLICLPTLYFFDILSGSKLDFKQYLTMALTAVAVISVLLFSFAPVILFFLVSIKDYFFFLLLNVLIMGVTGTIGVRLFYKGMRDISDTSEAAPSKSRRYLLQGWVILYGLVGSQLGWTLRPFFGFGGGEFSIFRPDVAGNNFYTQVARSIGIFMNWN